ncbi:uncharacterized protein EKO05_0006173 [Ascochyta rabiei]|uniref:Uncharacterized protein n=1 Tax=Didymella rabiei TaxID=5454 RepID=A0A163AV39_DIDRA|nr:uncharacterized protein EKO05_0006173 [Ascochyta rabiei]KZM21411.1 hypothetical protein ST47_g7447 [Ascochyta rabiei]UPX15733.1 hypothetical protein EKO05_0006173 [Ascochyta rabiei]
MESRNPPVPYSATHAPSAPSAPSHSSSPSLPADTDYDCDSEYNEKDARAAKDSARTHRRTQAAPGRAHDSVLSPLSPSASVPPSPSSSISSHAARKHRSITEIHETQARQSRSLSYPPRAHLDPEKADYYDSPREHRSQNRASLPDAAAVVYDKSEYHEKGPEDKAWQLLFYLSAPCALLSIAITFWTVIATLVSLALYPLRFCTSRPSLSAQLTTFLAPALNLQLHLVYSFDASESYSVPMLLVIHLFSPIIAFGIAVAAWTAAGFWFFSSILGDPGGHDGGRHNDGKDCILGVRNHWERWLLRGLR